MRASSTGPASWEASGVGSRHRRDGAVRGGSSPFPRPVDGGMIRPKAGEGPCSRRSCAMTITMRPSPPNLRDAPAVAELFVGVFRRDLLNFYPQSRFEPVIPGARPEDVKAGPNFQLIEESESGGEPLQALIFGVPYRLVPRCGGRFSAHDRRMIRA